MTNLTELLARNRAEWDDNVQAGDLYTKPWLHLTQEDALRFARAELSGFHEPAGPIDNPMLREIRRIIYEDVAGKRVLCLASGGGQQSALFSLLGADVTVADLSQKQLDGDIQAARHYGYDIRTELLSMTDLSAFEDDFFDIVYQPVSICFVPDVLPVYREVYRVLRPGGMYTVAHINPATYPACFDGGPGGWDGTGYRIAEPYAGGAIRMDETGRENMERGEPTGEFRHLYTDIFCELTKAGLSIKYVWEDARNFVRTGAAPGSEAHSHKIVQKYFEVLAVKSCD